MNTELKRIKKTAMDKFKLRMERNVAHSTPKRRHAKRKQLLTASPGNLDGWVIVTPGGTKRHGVSPIPRTRSRSSSSSSSITSPNMSPISSSSNSSSQKMSPNSNSSSIIDSPPSPMQLPVSLTATVSAKPTYASVVARGSKDNRSLSDPSFSPQHPFIAIPLSHIPRTDIVGESEQPRQSVHAVPREKQTLPKTIVDKVMPATKKTVKINTKKNKKIVTNKSRSNATKETSATHSNSAVCYVCFKRVSNLQSHLNRACFPKHGYSQPQRLRLAAQEKQRFQRWRNACVTQSNLYSQSVIGNDNEAYININVVSKILQESGVLICHDLKDNSLVNKVKLAAKASKTIPNLPQMPSSPVLESEPTNTNKPYLPGVASPVAGPSGTSNERRVSDAKRQLFDDGEEEHPRLEMIFLDGSGREDEPILTVKTVNLNDSSSSEDLPLASLITGSNNQPLKFTTIVKEQINPPVVINKFNMETCPTLIKYKGYLTTTVRVSNPLFINPYINNINKVLYFLHPEDERLESLCNTTKIHEFFNQLPAEMSYHGYNNYIKAIVRFLAFCEQSDDITLKHPTLISNLCSIRDTINDIRQLFLNKKRKAAALNDNADQAQLEQVHKNKKIKLAESQFPCINAIFNSIANKFVITTENNLPSFACVRSIALENNPGVILDKASIARIRDRFKYQRNVLRVADAIAYFPRVRPTEQQVKDYLISKNWFIKRTLVDVLKNWNPSDRRDMAKTTQANLDKELLQSISTQKWNKCLIRNTGDQHIGKGVFAKHAIKKGEVVCDYHGDLLSHKDGMHLYNTYPPEINHYMMFFEFNGTKYCIDGNTKCSCHNFTKDQIKGRLINHSKTQPNIICKPKLLNNVPRVLLHAKVDIELGDELKFDYGVANDRISREDGANSFLAR